MLPAGSICYGSFVRRRVPCKLTNAKVAQPVLVDIYPMHPRNQTDNVNRKGAPLVKPPKAFIGKVRRSYTGLCTGVKFCA